MVRSIAKIAEKKVLCLMAESIASEKPDFTSPNHKLTPLISRHIQEFKGRIVTPGTVTEDSMLQEGVSNYLASVFRYKDESAIAFVDTSTGKLLLTTLGQNRVSESVWQIKKP